MISKNINLRFHYSTYYIRNNPNYYSSIINQREIQRKKHSFVDMFSNAFDPGPNEQMFEIIEFTSLEKRSYDEQTDITTKLGIYAFNQLTNNPLDNKNFKNKDRNPHFSDGIVIKPKQPNIYSSRDHLSFIIPPNYLSSFPNNCKYKTIDEDRVVTRVDIEVDLLGNLQEKVSYSNGKIEINHYNMITRFDTLGYDVKHWLKPDGEMFDLSNFAE
jgi:hypothetical protein